jgi:MFS family permease
MGISPGAALVFLVSGPATNAAAITTIWKMLGRRTVAVYLATIAVSALLAGWLLDRFATKLPLGTIVESCEHHHFAWWDHAFAVLLLIVLAQGILPAKRKHINEGRNSPVR